MHVQARPGLHHAPVDGGVHISGAAGEFSLHGSDVLSLALDALVPTMLQGADENDLVALLGGEPTRPLVRALVSQLLEHDLLLDLDALSEPPPSDAVRAHHPDALAHLEAVDPDPYAAFSRLQDAVVRVHGVGAPVDAVRRGLLRGGVGLVVDAYSAPDLDADLVLVLDAPDDAEDAASNPADEPTVPHVLVRLEDDVALVSLDGPRAPATDLWRRVRGWAPRLARGPLPRPGADVVAAGYAVVLALEVLRDADQEVAGLPAVVLSGTKSGVESVLLTRADPGTIHRLEPETPQEDVTPEAEELRELVETTAAPWTGEHDASGGLDLPQLPIALRQGVPVAHEGPTRVAAGADQEQVALALSLQMRRDAGGRAGAAGTTRLRWLLDGALRALAGRAVPIDDDPDRRAVPGLGWVLARIGGRAAWAPTVEEAMEDAAALAVAATVVSHSDEEGSVVGVGTDALGRADDEVVALLAKELLALGDAEGFGVIGVRAVDDPALPASDDDVSIWSGPVRLDGGAR